MNRSARLRRTAARLAGALPVLLAAVAVAAALLPSEATAAEASTPGLRIPPLDPQLPWTIEADHLTHDPERDEYVAEGNVLLAKMDRAISADRVRYSRRDRMAYAEGHVIVTVGTDRLSGSYLEMDLESERGYLDNGTIFIRETNYHISGNRIERVGADLYAIDRGVVTTCDGDPPDWKISGRDVKIHENGSGSAWNALVYARDVPLLYFPYVSFPARNERQSGFLFPEMGYSSRRGVYYNQPFFWAIDDQTDATLYLEYMSERGWKPGVEYRYYLTRDAKGAVMFDYLHDDKVDNGQGSSTEDWGYPDAGLRPNRDRYWFRMSHVNPLPGGFLGRVDLDVPSDQDYLRDFIQQIPGPRDGRVRRPGARQPAAALPLLVGGQPRRGRALLQQRHQGRELEGRHPSAAGGEPFRAQAARGRNRLLHQPELRVRQLLAGTRGRRAARRPLAPRVLPVLLPALRDDRALGRMAPDPLRPVQDRQHPVL
nr:hypothetical protein [Desulfobacterales bacterium]